MKPLPLSVSPAAEAEAREAAQWYEQVFFRVRSDRIKIVAVMHLARDPERWRRRR